MAKVTATTLLYAQTLNIQQPLRVHHSPIVCCLGFIDTMTDISNMLRPYPMLRSSLGNAAAKFSRYVLCHAMRAITNDGNLNCKIFITKPNNRYRQINTSS